jgi:hypothetical protein
MTNDPHAIVIHCTDVSWRTLRDQFKSVNAYHRDEREFPLSQLGYYVGYHRLITGGRNYQARLDKEVGAHTNQTGPNEQSMNVQSLGICVGFDGDIELPHPDDYALLQAQIREWQARYNIPNERVYFHRDFSKSKTCPGALCTPAWLKELLSGEPTAKPLGQKMKQAKIQDQITTLMKLVQALTALRDALLKGRP